MTRRSKATKLKSYGNVYPLGTWGQAPRSRRDGIKGFTAKQVTWHRNGISGRSFWSVAFSYVEGETLKANMLATVPVDGVASGPDVECYVVDMDDTSMCWRGDSFVGPVFAAIKAHDTGC